MRKILIIITVLFSVNIFSQKISFKKFSGKNVDVKHILAFSQQAYCFYLKNEISKKQIDKEASRILSFLKEQDNVSQYIPIHKYEFTRENKKIIFLKYEKVHTVDTIEVRDFLVKTYQETENDFSEYQESNDRVVSLIYSVIKISKSNLLIQFFNQDDDVNYPKINELKPQVKSSTGTIDIEKLAEVIIANANSLSEYLE